MLVRHVMTRDSESVGPEETVAGAAQLLAGRTGGVLPVVREGRVVGTLSSRDIAVKTVARGGDPLWTLVYSVMSTPAACCHEDDDVQVAVRVMRDRGVRRLPVLDCFEALAGVVSFRSIANAEGLAAREHAEVDAGPALPLVAASLAGAGSTATVELDYEELS